MDKKSVMIVDEHPLLRQGLRQTINQEPDLRVCCEAGDFPAMLRLLQSEPPDVLIMDIPTTDHGVAGLEMIRQIHAETPATAILIFSTHDEKVYAERAVRAGASGYLMKQTSSDQVVDAIRRVAAGELALSPALTQAILRRSLGDKPLRLRRRRTSVAGAGSGDVVLPPDREAP